MRCCSLNPPIGSVSLHVVERYPAAGPGYPIVRDDGARVQTSKLRGIVIDAYHRVSRYRYRGLDLKVDPQR